MRVDILYVWQDCTNPDPYGDPANSQQVQDCADSCGTDFATGSVASDDEYAGEAVEIDPFTKNVPK